MHRNSGHCVDLCPGSRTVLGKYFPNISYIEYISNDSTMSHNIVCIVKIFCMFLQSCPRFSIVEIFPVVSQYCVKPVSFKIMCNIKMMFRKCNNSEKILAINIAEMVGEIIAK